MSFLSFLLRPFSSVATVQINGNTYQGSQITVLVDGIDRTPQDRKTIDIRVTGDVTSLDVGACRRVEITGSAGSVRTASGDVQVGGDVAEDVSTASGDVLVKGNIGGNVQTASGDVVARTITGKVSTVSGDIDRG